MSVSSIYSRFREGVNSGFGRQLQNIGHLMSGNIVNAAVMLISVAIAARALGPFEYGVLVLILSYGRVIERFLRFESWQPLIKFAADEEHAQSSSKPRMARLYLYGLLLDTTSCALAAITSIGLFALIAPLFNLEARFFDFVAIYSIALLFNISGMPTAALRLAGRFRTIAYCQIVANILRALLALLCWYQGYGLLGFVIVWTLSQIFSASIFLFLGFRALKDLHIPSPLVQSPRHLPRDFPGFFSFGLSTNLSSSLRTLTQEADTLLVGMLAGPVPAGFYNLAKRMAKIAMQVGAHIQAVLYPDMARLWSRESFRKFRKMILRIQIVMGAFGLFSLCGAWLLGNWAIGLAFGTQYSDAYPLLLTQLLAIIFIMHASPSRSALLAMGKPGIILVVNLVATMIFFLLSFWLIPNFGPIGANIAHIGAGIVVAIALEIGWMHGLSKKLPNPRKTSPSHMT